MKSLFRRPALVLALLAGVALAACGGKAMFTVGGTVDKVNFAGVLYPGLILTDGANTLSVPAGAPSFAFPNQIPYGATYNIVATTPPLHQTCSVVNGSDTAGRMAAIAATLDCTVNAYTVGGTVTGLTVDGLVLINGSNVAAVTVNASTTTDLPTFVFGTVVYNVAYGVTVLTQPTGLFCTVGPNGTGIMGDAAVTNITVNCVPRGLGG